MPEQAGEAYIYTDGTVVVPGAIRMFCRGKQVAVATAKYDLSHIEDEKLRLHMASACCRTVSIYTSPVVLGWEEPPLPQPAPTVFGVTPMAIGGMVTLSALATYLILLFKGLV